MKKLLALLIAVLVVFSSLLILSSCGSDEEDSYTTKRTRTSESSDDNGFGFGIGGKNGDDIDTTESTAEITADTETDTEPFFDTEADTEADTGADTEDDDDDVIGNLSGDIVGKWRGSIDYAPVMEDMGMDFSDYGVDFSDSYVGIYFDFSSDGECTVTFDEDDFRAILTNVFVQIAEHSGISIETLAAALGYGTIGEYIDTVVDSSEINSEFTGDYSYAPGELTFGDVVFETTYNGSELVLKRLISGSNDTFENYILPLTLTK